MCSGATGCVGNACYIKQNHYPQTASVNWHAGSVDHFHLLSGKAPARDTLYSAWELVHAHGARTTAPAATAATPGF